MGGLAGMVGLGGGQSGTGISGPAQAIVQSGTTTDQTQNAYAQNQGALAQQNALLGALNQQGGLGNQSNVYNQLQGVANGTGPNPAQAMLNQNTGANVANQAALMAGQRGSNANAGLLARQAAMQGGNLQQQAVGQGATMQANQSLNALGQMGTIANTQAANQIAATNANTQVNQAEQGNLLNALGGMNTANVGSQGSVNAGNTQLANTQLQGQQAVVGGLMNSMGSMGNMMGGMMKAKGGEVSAYDDGGEVPSEPAPPLQSAQNMLPLQSNMNPTSGVGPVANGAQYANAIQANPVQQGPQSSIGQFMSGVKNDQPAQATQPAASGPNPGAEALAKGVGSMFSAGQTNQSGGSGGGSSGLMQMLPMLAAAASKGGEVGSGEMVDIVVSPGEKVINPDKVGKAAGGKVEARTVPGKAEVPGDSLKNDKVKMKAKPGTIIVPRTKSKDNKKAASFVQATLAKRGRK